MAASLVEILQQIVVGSQVDAGKVVLLDDVGYADGAVLIECVEREVVDTLLHKVFIEILCDDLLNQSVFCLGDFSLCSLPDKHDEIFQEAYLLDVQLLSLDGKGVHRDRMFIGIADVLATNILTESFVGVTCIDHDNIGILFPHLANYAVHVERLTASTWTQTEEVGVVRNLVLALLATDVYGNRNTLPVGIVYFQWGVLAVLYMFLIHHASGCVAQCEETVVVGVHAIAVAGEGVDKKLQLVISSLADMDAQTSE